MDKKSMTLALGLLLLAGSVSAGAYHITGVPANGGTSAKFWGFGGPGLIVCESDGLSDPRNANPTSNSGVGGLCTAGETVTGTWGATWGGNVTPNATRMKEWVQFDLCDATCLTTAIAYDAEVGVYFCAVPANSQLYYKVGYAWWSYDGNGVTETGPGFHGHVAAFYTGPAPTPPAVLNGTATVNNTGVTVPLTAAPCGSSPATGPVAVA